jgi:ribosomal protein S7
MSNIFIFKKNEKYSNRYDYYSYVWFRYHKLFFGSLIVRGRKLWAFNFFIKLHLELKKREQIEPYWVFLVGIMKITPELMLFPLKLGGVVQGVPLPITERKQYTFAVKWIIKLLKDKLGKFSLKTVSDVIIDAIYNKGLSIERKLSIYEIGSKNRHLIKFFK